MKQIKQIVMPLAAAALLAVGAQAQVRNAIEGEPYLVASIEEAQGAGTVTYEWYRIGEFGTFLIAECTEASCLIPARLCQGYNVEIRRKVVMRDCFVGGTSEAWSNPVYVTFRCGGHGTRMSDGLCWADRNVGQAGAFAANPDDRGMFYQFNTNRAWSPTGSVTDWQDMTGNALNTPVGWTINTHPCPPGWRLPSLAEYMLLFNGQIGNGGTWANIGTRGNALSGRFHGRNHATCSLPSNMSECIFLPAAGYRDDSGVLNFEDGMYGYGWYWSSAYNTSAWSTLATSLLVSRDRVDDYISWTPRATAMPLRCVYIEE